MGFNLKEFLNLNNKEKQQSSPQPASTAQSSFKPFDNSFTRGLSRGYDQVNTFDNNRTWKQTEATNKKSAWQQAGQTGGQVARGAVGGLAQMANTIGAQVPQVYYTGKGMFDTHEYSKATEDYLKASKSGDKAWIARAKDRSNKASQRLSATMAMQEASNDMFTEGSGGLLNAGTFYNSDDARRGDVKTAVTKVGGGTAQAMLEAGSLMFAAPVGKAVATQGIKAGVKSQVPNLVKSFGLNTAQGGVTAYNQEASGGDILKSAALSGVLGTAGDVGIGVGGAYVSKAVKPTVSKVTTSLVSKPSSKPFVINNPDGANIDGFKVNNNTGAPLIQQPPKPFQINDPYNFQGKPLKVVNNSGGPLVGENLSGAAQQSHLSKQASQPWYHGTRQLNEGKGDTFYSGSKEVAGDYSIMNVGDKPNISVAKNAELPKNSLRVMDKQELAETIGYKGDPFNQPKGMAEADLFDTQAKAYAKSKGYDSIHYQEGSFGEPELHAFGKTAPVKPLESSNPTGTVFTDYNPSSRTGMLGKNMTTLDKAVGKNADEMVTVYRGATSNQSKLAPGDFITTNKQLAQDYAGTGKVIETKVKYSDIATSKDEWQGGEHIYQPKAKPKLSNDQAGFIAPGQIASDIKDFGNKLKARITKGPEQPLITPPKKSVPIVGQNLSRSSTNNIPKEPKLKQSKFAQGVAGSDEISPELQAQVKKNAPTYIPLENADQVAAATKLVNKGYKKASVEVTERLEKELGKIDGQDVADTIHVIKELDKRGGVANLQKATELSNKLSEHLTKAGQTVQAASLLKNRTPEGMLYGARKFLKNNGVELTPDIQKQLDVHIKDIRKLKGDARVRAIAELQHTVEGYVPSSAADKAIGIWKAGLLTGVKTQTGNLLSGTATNVLKTISDAPAALIDQGFAAFGKTAAGKSLGFTGDRAKAFTLKGKATGGVEGAKKGWTALKTGIDERNIEASKFDTKRLVFSKKPLGRAAQFYTEKIYGLMGAADRPNYYSNLKNNLYDLGIVEAKNKGLKGQAKDAFIKDFVDSPSAKHFQTATDAAEKAIFANDTQLSKIAGSVRQAADSNIVSKAAAGILMPFTKVPSSVAMRMVDYSPVGVLKTVGEQIRNVKKGGVLDQRALSEGLAQAGTGTGALVLGMQLRNAGLMTGSYPTDPKERELWKVEGKQENSIKVYNPVEKKWQWKSINYFSPVGQVLSVGSKMADAHAAGGSATDVALAGGFAIPKTITEQSFLQGVQGALDAVHDPEKQGAKFVKSTGASVVPTLVSDVAKATDPLQRQVNTFPDAVKNRLPWANKTLDPKQDAFGEDLARKSSAANTMFDPFRSSDVKPKTDLNSELRRLQDNEYGIMPNTTDKTYTFGSEKKGTQQKVVLTSEQLYDKNSDVGKLVKTEWERMIHTPEYAKMSDYERQAALSRKLEDVNALGKAKYAAKNQPELLTKDDKLSKDQINLATGSGSSNDYLISSKDRSAAELEKEYEEFKDSGKTFETKNGYVYRLDASGNPTKTTQVKFDYQVGTAKLTQAKRNNNLSAYIETANKQLDSIEKQLQDPNIDPLDAITLQNDAEALQSNIEKYSGYGGFKKGKTAKKGKATSKEYSLGSLLTTGAGSSNALRNIVKGSRIIRKRVKR